LNGADFPKLLSPISIGSITVKNRVVSTAHAGGFSWTDPRDSGERQIAYFERRAAGGVGLFVHESLIVTPTPDPYGVYAYDYMRDRFGRLAEAVNRHGAKLVLQLLNPGASMRTDADPEMGPLWSFSGTTTPEGEATHQMTSEEIGWMINGFVQCARIAVESGLDGVELHATHGYLLQQSFSPWANQRDDEWREPLKFIRTVIARVRGAIGRAPVVGLRITLDDFTAKEDGGVGSDGLLEIARTLATEGGLDYFNHSEGARMTDYAKSIGTWRHPHGEFIPLAGALKRTLGPQMPVIGVGRIVTPEHAEQILQSGACDLVAMTRAHIADPDIVAKIQAGEAHRVRRCVGSNQGCVDRLLVGLAVTCFHNPEVGREYQLGAVTQAAVPKRVLVVGGGPAGLKAAEIAARRGHQVTLVERNARLGGRILLAARLEAAHELAHSVEWLEAELRLLQVTIRTQTEIDDDLIAAVAPETVVLATGATPNPEGAFGAATDDSVPVISTDEAMTAALAGKKMLVLDRLGAHDAVRAAEHAAQGGAHVTIISPRPMVGAFVGITHAAEIPRRLSELGCEIEPNWDALAIKAGVVRLRSTLSGKERLEQFDVVAVSVPATPNVALRGIFERAGIPVRLAGDAMAARTALHAFRAGDAAGRAV